MHLIILALIIAGALNMVKNILRFYQFMRNTQDVLSSGRKRDIYWQRLAFVLLIFFLFGYLFAGFLSKPDLMVAFILFFGSIFVTIVETLMFTLMNTAKERSLDIADVLIGVIDTRDPNLNGHSRHVKNITMLLYQHLPNQLKKQINPVSLEYAALLHDVGKLGVPEAILNKPAKLDPEEWAVMTTHPKVGVKILKPLHTFDNISDWILYHHERIDGNGYYKLPGEKIPLAARIIAVADTYSAITMRRSYKTEKTHEDAIEIMKSVSGTQLDKGILEIFLTIPKEELLTCIPENVDYF